MFFQENPVRNLVWGPFAFPWALIRDIRLADSVQQGSNCFLDPCSSDTDEDLPKLKM